MQKDVRNQLVDVWMTRLIEQMMSCGVRLEGATARCDPGPPTWHLSSSKWVPGCASDKIDLRLGRLKR
jgi:hypothetical protein